MDDILMNSKRKIPFPFMFLVLIMSDNSEFLLLVTSRCAYFDIRNALACNKARAAVLHHCCRSTLFLFVPWTEFSKIFRNSTNTVRKDISTYVEIFNALIEKAAVLRVILQPQTPSSLQCTDHFRAFELSYFHFFQAVLRKVANPGIQTRGIHETETKKTVKMLLVTAFLPLQDLPAAVELFGKNVTSPIAALFNYFRKEWMTPNILPLRLAFQNKPANKNVHFSFRELLQLLIDGNDQWKQETKRKMKMLLVTFFLPVPQADTDVSLLEAGTAGSTLALFQ
ncbi:hypothetical protein T07_1818 [Trichinella nelsoni]|uniref:Uncharacterized protein n=1 Tax=Trichinella nelsoni TaxID=6336 RepID=A0A0V0RKR7_9BILA|nr:hypothetical protein T07_1818 [Trichinella nelsoni]